MLHHVKVYRDSVSTAIVLVSCTKISCVLSLIDYNEALKIGDFGLATVYELDQK